MMFEYLKLNLPVEDEIFNSIYPEAIQKLAKRHWTPVAVARQAAEYLAEIPGTKVLDIGSGAGKFCMLGASCTKGIFTGIEQRAELVRLSKKLLSRYTIRNVEFIHTNLSTISFTPYNAFYFYNSFYENIDATAKIDHTIGTDPRLYIYYSAYLRAQLAAKPIGTRLVTYWSSGNEVPLSFRTQFTLFEGRLKFWEKVT